jgi:putative Mn2+ efflux pump MntP
MELYEYIIIAITMAMDAFAVSICKGVSSKGKMLKTGLVCGLWFGIFQALMPFIGWLFGELLMQFIDIESISGYIAFLLLSFLGFKMIKESLEEECGCCEADSSLAFKVMIVFAIATSIDALAIGVTISLLNASILLSMLLIGTITFLMSFVGSIIGAKVGSKYEKKAELAGGIVLVLLGIKFLIEAIF